MTEPTPSPSPDITRLTTTLDSLREGLQIIDRDWRYVYLNKAAAHQGRRPPEAYLGRTMMECYPGIESTPMFAALTRCMNEREPASFDNEFAYPDGTKASFDLRIAPCPEGISVLSVDISERRALEAQLRQGQKMEAIGRLAGGVAHDFNNLLTIIHTAVSFARDAVPESTPLRADLDDILGASQRAAALTQQLLAFARRQTIEPRVVDPSSLVASLGPLLRRVLGEDVKLAVVPQADSWRTLIDPGAFEQVLMNLAVNARQAMPQGGCLTIETQNVTLDEAYSVHRGSVMPPGDYFMLAVSDNGVGMDADVRERLFDPFFTTREEGSGTGLGLATSYGIVRQANGFIWVYSEPGRGSTFKIYLPRVMAPLSPEAPVSALAAATGSEILLVVEDDLQVRRMVVRVLENAGYTVLPAADANEAMTIAAQYQGRVDLLLTDVVMPGRNGRQLAEAMAPLQEHMQVLFMSGYTENAMLNEGVLSAGTRMLAKPFSPTDLRKKIREALDSVRRS